jgi:hypothetical protein
MAIDACLCSWTPGHPTVDNDVEVMPGGLWTIDQELFSEPACPAVGEDASVDQDASVKKELDASVEDDVPEPEPGAETSPASHPAKDSDVPVKVTLGTWSLYRMKRGQLNRACHMQMALSALHCQTRV